MKTSGRHPGRKDLDSPKNEWAPRLVKVGGEPISRVRSPGIPGNAPGVSDQHIAPSRWISWRDALFDFGDGKKQKPALFSTAQDATLCKIQESPFGSLFSQQSRRQFSQCWQTCLARKTSTVTPINPAKSSREISPLGFLRVPLLAGLVTTSID